MNINWNEIYKRVYDWVLSYGPGIILAVIIFISGIFLIRLINRWVKKAILRKGVNPSVRYFLQNLIALILQIMLVIICLQVAGLKLTVFSAIVAGLTVAIGLAMSGMLQNFVSGILILFLKPYRVGDNISTQGQEGKVTSIQLFYTIILTFDNRTMIIPNGQLSNTVVLNLSKEGRRRLDIDLRFGYTIDFNRIKNILEKTLSPSKDIFPEPAVRIGISLLEPDRYVVTINTWTSADGFYDTKLALNEKIMNALKEANIKLPGM